MSHMEVGILPFRASYVCPKVKVEKQSNVAKIQIEKVVPIEKSTSE